MFISNEFSDEEIFPAAYFINLSVNEDSEKCCVAFSEAKIFEKIVAAICFSNDFQLKMMKITTENLYLIISKNWNLKNKGNLLGVRTDILTLFTNVLKKAERQGELCAFYELWDVRQVEEAMEFFENISKETPTDSD